MIGQLGRKSRAFLMHDKKVPNTAGKSMVGKRKNCSRAVEIAGNRKHRPPLKRCWHSLVAGRSGSPQLTRGIWLKPYHGVASELSLGAAVGAFRHGIFGQACRTRISITRKLTYSAFHWLLNGHGRVIKLPDNSRCLVQTNNRV